MLAVKAYGTANAAAPVAPLTIQRRDPGPTDVAIDILYCGVCHSDIHQARDEWHNTLFPCVPGHEIVGRVRGGQCRHQVQSRRSRCCRLSCRFLSHVSELPRGHGAVLRSRNGADLQWPRQASRWTYIGRLFTCHRRG